MCKSKFRPNGSPEKPSSHDVHDIVDEGDTEFFYRFLKVVRMHRRGLSWAGKEHTRLALQEEMIDKARVEKFL
jgi:hypothetical protein